MHYWRLSRDSKSREEVQYMLLCCWWEGQHTDKTPTTPSSPQQQHQELLPHPNDNNTENVISGALVYHTDNEQSRFVWSVCRQVSLFMFNSQPQVSFFFTRGLILRCCSSFRSNCLSHLRANSFLFIFVVKMITKSASWTSSDLRTSKGIPSSNSASTLPMNRSSSTSTSRSFPGNW